MSASRDGSARQFVQAMTSWRTASVALLSFASGLPLGLVWIAVPDWMRSIGVDIRVVGLITLAQAPWSFKMLWSPLMDRYAPPGLGRRRGWALLSQVALCALTLVLAGVGTHPDTPWVIGAIALAIAFASATQDIAVDAYAVDVLRPEEQGIAVGARVALYRAAMLVAGALSITAAARFSWPIVLAVLAMAYVPFMAVARNAPEPERPAAVPKRLRDAVWHPFLGLLARHRALEILAFVFFYKLADNLAGALLRPFLNDMGYDATDRGVVTGGIGLITTIAGTFLGGAMTQFGGLGRALWISGILQLVSNVGYVFVSQSAVNRPLMYSAASFESFCTGLGTGAFSVLLLRMTQKRFSATQYAVLSSLFSVPRLLAGPVAGYAAHAVGWTTFMWATIAAGIPGLVLLYRFCPPGVREPEFRVEERPPTPPIPVPRLVAIGSAAGLAVAIAAAAVAALMSALAKARGAAAGAFDYSAALGDLLHPVGAGPWTTLAGVIVTGLVGGFFAAAVLAARRGNVAPE